MMIYDDYVYTVYMCIYIYNIYIYILYYTTYIHTYNENNMYIYVNMDRILHKFPKRYSIHCTGPKDLAPHVLKMVPAQR